jgi:hypothetical protein
MAIAKHQFDKECMKKIYSYRAKDLKKWGIAGDISIQDIEELLVKQNYTCYVCKDKVLLDSWISNCLYQFSIDRINEHFPHDRDNFLISCYHCNCTSYIREDSEKKICINGCHKDGKLFKLSREDVLPDIKHLRLTQNLDRDIQIKNAYEKIYEHKKALFEQKVSDFRNNKLKILLDKRNIIQQLFIMFKKGITTLYTPTKEFMNQLFDIRMRIHNSAYTYMYMSTTIIRPFHDWYTEIQTKLSYMDNCSIEISPKNILIHRFDDKYESCYKSKLKKKIEKIYQRIYKQKEFEFNPIHLMTISGLNDYFSFSYNSDINMENPI